MNPDFFPIRTHFLAFSQNHSHLLVKIRSNGRKVQEYPLEWSDRNPEGKNILQVSVHDGEYLLEWLPFSKKGWYDTAMDPTELAMDFSEARIGGIGFTDIRGMMAKRKIQLTYFLEIHPLQIAVIKGEPRYLHFFSPCDPDDGCSAPLNACSLLVELGNDDHE